MPSVNCRTWSWGSLLTFKFSLASRYIMKSCSLITYRFIFAHLMRIIPNICILLWLLLYSLSDIHYDLITWNGIPARLGSYISWEVHSLIKCSNRCHLLSAVASKMDYQAYSGKPYLISHKFSHICLPPTAHIRFRISNACLQNQKNKLQTLYHVLFKLQASTGF